MEDFGGIQLGLWLSLLSKFLSALMKKSIFLAFAFLEGSLCGNLVSICGAGYLLRWIESANFFTMAFFLVSLKFEFSTFNFLVID